MITQNKLTKKEVEFVKTYQETISKIVITSACSNIPPKYIEGLKEINKKYGYTQCVTCNSSIFIATNKLYKDALYTKSVKKSKTDNNANKTNDENKIEMEIEIEKEKERERERENDTEGKK